jgi:hypothetical protein
VSRSMSNTNNKYPKCFPVSKGEKQQCVWQRSTSKASSARAISPVYRRSAATTRFKSLVALLRFGQRVVAKEAFGSAASKSPASVGHRVQVDFESQRGSGDCAK